jgi:hypothetical protein
VISPEDMGPRTFLAGTLPPVHVGKRLLFDLRDVPAIYAPRLPPGRMNPRWIGLVSEWRDFLTDDLAVLKGPAERGAWKELTGLGPGSTPAGDDFLSGLASGMLWQGKTVPFHPDPGLTSWLSGDMLRDACEGGIWCRAKCLLEALASDEPKAVTKSAGSIADWGHTSGRAWLAGLSEALCRERDG